MNKDNANVYITLYGDGNKEYYCQVERIFNIEGTKQMYCGVVPVDGEFFDNMEIIFLRCELMEKGEETDIIVSDIPTMDEYERVSETYKTNTLQAALESAHEEVANYDDVITVTDVDGKEKLFIIHTIFDDESTKRSYIAVQEVLESGEIVEEISLYRFNDVNEKPMMEMIASDMEYENARKLFLSFLN